MNAVYDHMLAIVFIGIVFVWAVSVVPSLSFNNIQAANQQQLRNMELNVFNELLLDTGTGLNGTQNTTDWGSIIPFDESKVSRLGLASASEDAFFTLDPDKVQRLVADNPMGSISYEQTKELLGLEGYNFMLQIIPPFNVLNTDGTTIDSDHSPINVPLLETGVLHYEIKVVYLDGRPISNATVQSKVMYTKGTDFFMLEPNSTRTNEMGVNIFNANLVVTDPYSVMVIMTVSVADVATIVVTFGEQHNNIVDISMVDDQVILTANKEPNNAASWIMDMYYYSSEGSLPHLYTGGKTQANKINTGSGQLWSREFNGLKSLEPVLIVIDILSVDNGRRDLIVAGPYQNLLGYTVFEYGAGSADQMPIVSTQRSVVICGMTYTAQFILWKDSA